MTPILQALTILLPFLAGIALCTLSAPWGAIVAGLLVLAAAAFQGAAQLCADPWEDFQGMEGDD